jgi:hypothetical protein
MKIRHALAGVIACAGFAAATASAASAQININGNINRQVAPLTAGATGRVEDDGVGTASTCGAPKAFPGTLVGGMGVAYRTHTVFNSGPARCVTVTVTASGCAGNNGGAFPVVYSGSFNPAALATGYVADSGATTDGTNPAVVGIDLGAGEQVDLVIFSNGSSGDPGSCNYNIVSAELSVAAVAVPTLGEWAMIGLGGLLAAFGFAALRNRRRAV